MNVSFKWKTGITIGILVFGTCGLNHDSRDSRLLVQVKETPTQESGVALIEEAWSTIRRVYVGRSAINPSNLAHGAINGMVEALEDHGHSTFFTKEMFNEEHEFIEGRRQGVGIDLRVEAGHAIIVAPLDGSPAQRAGLRPGDVITRIDGKSLIGLDHTEIMRRIVGAAGTRVRLTILDPLTSETKEVSLIRRSLEVSNVRWKRVPGTAVSHVRIAGFSKGVSKSLRQALSQIQKEKSTALILDLRDDPGGLLDEAVSCASLFLHGGNVLLEKNAAGSITPVPVRREAEVVPLPLVVLVNEGSASAAEILAGAIRDAGRGVLVGEKTFGAGSVLQDFELADGSVLTLAVEEWLTPKGESIWHKGITPDVEVVLPEGVRPLFPRDEAGLTAAAVRATKDIQLRKALELLSSPR